VEITVEKWALRIAEKPSKYGKMLKPVECGDTITSTPSARYGNIGPIPPISFLATSQRFVPPQFAQVCSRNFPKQY
jgi:hypothetical protein